MAEARKTAAKAAAPTQTPGDQLDQKPTGLTPNTGPGTGTAAPEDTQVRSQARMSGAHASAPESAPIEAPDLHGATAPAEGLAASSTNKVTDAVSLRSYAGEDHNRLVDDQGNEVDLEKAFTDPGVDKTFMTANGAILEEYFPIGALREGPDAQKFTRLMFAPGARVNKGTVARLKSEREGARLQASQPSVRANHPADA